MYIYCIQNLLLSSDMVVKPNFSMVLGNDLVVNDFRNHNIFGIHYRKYSKTAMAWGPDISGRSRDWLRTLIAPGQNNMELEFN